MINAVVVSLAAFQSTLPTRGSDRRDFEAPAGVYDISIHAPHEGERQHAAQGEHIITIISIHAPHEGERPKGLVRLGQEVCPFQSTLPTRGSDLRYGGKLRRAFPISIHAPHEGERRCPHVHI